MSPRETFIEAATATAHAGNHEFQQHFRGELERLTLEASDESLLLASAALSPPGALRERRKKRRTGMILALIAIIACLAPALHQAFVYHGEVAQFDASMSGGIIAYDTSSYPNLPAPGTLQRRLLMGDPGRAGSPDQFRSLWEAAPNNPVFFRAYLSGCLRAGSGRGLPAGFIETARGIDPDDGSLLLIAAAETAKPALKRATVSKPPKADEVVDPGRFNEAMGYFHEAVNRPRLHDYSLDLAAARLQAVPAATDYLSNYSTLYFMLSTGADFSGSLDLFRALGAAAQQDADAKDVESFKRLCRDCHELNRKLLQDNDQSLIHLLVEEAGLSIESKLLGPIATQFKLDDESAYFSTLDGQLTALRDERKRERSATDLALLQQKGNSFIGAPIFSPNPALTAVELAPGRLMEHAVMQRFLTLSACVILLAVLAAVSAYPFRATALVRSLGNVAVNLIPGNDLVAASFAAVVPILAVQAWIWSPYGSSAWAPFWGGIALGVLANLTSLVLAILLPLLVIGRRLGKRSIPLAGFHPANRWVAWIAVACAFASLGLMIGAPFLSGFESMFERQFDLFSGVGKFQLEGGSGHAISAALYLLGFVALYLIATAIRGLLSSRERLPLRFAISKLLLIPYLTAACTLALLQPVLHAWEEHWFARDSFSKITLDHPEVNGFEARVMTPAYQALREAVAAADAKIPH